LRSWFGQYSVEKIRSARKAIGVFWPKAGLAVLMARIANSRGRIWKVIFQPACLFAKSGRRMPESEVIALWNAFHLGLIPKKRGIASLHA